MTLGVRDIVNDLGVMNVTVWRWISQGKIKATIENRRLGWKIEEEEYARFLEEHPKWRMVHDGELFKSNEIRAREDALMRVLAKLISEKGVVKTEKRDGEYMQGFNRAVNDITAAIEHEMRKKGPEFIESRLEQVP
jgi:hypothetical protein